VLEPAVQVKPPPSAPSPPGHGRALRLIDEVREAQRRSLRAQGLLLGVPTSLVLFLAAGLMGASHPDLGLGLLVASPLAAVILLVVFGWVVPAQRVGDAARTARLLAQRVPELDLDLLAAVELSQAMGTREDFSPELARAFLRHVDARAARHRLSSLVDPRPLQRTGAAAVVLVVAVLAVLSVRGEAVKSGLLAVTSTRVSEPIRRTPITGDFQLTYRYPPYTGLEPRVIAGATGDIVAPAGTEVLIATHADRDVESSALIVNGARVPLSTQGRELSGSLVVDVPGQYHVAFLKGSRVVAEGPDLSITVDVDQPPQVRVTSPPEEVELDPAKQRLSLVYEAVDDYGLSALALVYRTAGGDEKRAQLKPDEGRTSRGRYEWDIGALGLRPGQTVSYYLEATDNDAVKGAKKGVSSTRTAKLFSAEEHRRAALTKASAVWERLVTHLADRLEGADRDSPASPERAQSGRTADERALQLIHDSTELANELEEDRAAPAELAQALENIGHELNLDTSAISAQRRLLLRMAAKDNPTGLSQPPLRQPQSSSLGDLGRRLSAAISADARRSEKNVLYLEALLDRQRLAAIQALAKELKEDRRELTRLLEEYAQNKDPALREALLAQMEALKARMLELRARMAELAGQIRDDFMNAEALQEMLEDENLDGSLESVERLVKEGKIEEALKELQKLSMAMDELFDRLSQASGEAERSTDPELAEKFKALQENLQSTVQQEEDLAERTRQLRDKYRQQQRERISRQGEALKRELGSRLDELERSFKQIDASRSGPQFQETKVQAQRELENVEQSLEANDFDLAHDSAERLEGRTEQLAEQADEQRRLDEMLQNPPEARRESKQLKERLQRDAKKAGEIAKRLKELFPQPGQQLSEGDRNALQEMSQRQRQLKQNAQQLQQQMDEINQRAPVFNQEALDQAASAGEKMESAGERLQRKDPGRGFGEQQGALQALRGLQESMEEAQKGGRGGLPMPLKGRRGGRGNHSERVEIPDEDPNQPPRDFRKDVMDAMKQGAPDRYRDQNKRYYEELVK
jgi:hypothetical protein